MSLTESAQQISVSWKNIIFVTVIGWWHINRLSETMEEYKEYLEAALDMAREAGNVLMSHYRRSDLASSTKQNSFDVVTEADKASEALIVKRIGERFPSHSVLAEESGASGDAAAEWQWVIDPLDGTTNYSQGLPVFCVSIALRYKATTVVGVVYAPALGELFEAVRGGGARLNGKPIGCSRKQEPDRMVVATGVPYDKGVNPDNNLDNIVRVAPRVRGIRRMGSAAIDLSYTAAGFFDAYWELNLQPWDVAAGALIVEEAGGVVEPIRTNRNVSVIAGSRESLSVFRPLIK